MPRADTIAALIGLASALGALGPGCVVYDPALVRRGPSCALRTVPPRAMVADSEDGPEVSFALRRVLLDQDDRWPEVAYDVDGRCTSMPAYERECTAPSGANPIEDGPGGADNVFGASLYPTVAIVQPDLEQSARDAQDAADGTPVLRLRGWNGQRNDPRVDLVITQAVWALAGGDETTPPALPPEPRAAAAPAWDGRDWVWVRDDAFLMGNPERPLIRDDNAYVVDGVIVARLPDRIDIIFPADEYGVLVRLTDARATARLSADGSALENVIVSGRWSIADLISTARNIGVCDDDPEFGILTRQLDRIADVRSTPGTGGTGVVCDAVSLGVEFEVGTRVRIAGVLRGPPLADLCSMPPGDGGVRDAGTSDAGP